MTPSGNRVFKDPVVRLSAGLDAVLPVAVLTALPQVARLTPAERRRLAKECADTVTAHGDDLLYGGPHCTTTFAALARGLAAGALQPGGVTVAGHHFCASPHEDCPTPGAAALHARLNS
ncbi:hypothetical protein NI17_009705 [Thermobifida halotolerans]|uniref:Uncharacterized protein n=1 Tax=Thermobifida halotolerans TaxID=483545 RepID=A0AA97M003_9ACTN|nr:hypothetical protein [Thermobifida halotolerans]UOE21367.1 hypothetical protein NI17_009705 [Thermobifida halotolerans]